MIETILKKLEAKKDLKSEEMQFAVESIMTGMVDDSDIEKFLLALNEKGIKEAEITAADRAIFPVRERLPDIFLTEESDMMENTFVANDY